MFMDFSMLANLDFVKSLMEQINFNFINTFNLSLALSQLISNVPASIFLTHFSNQYFAIAYGVNLGGNGLIIASLANIIALRFINKGYLIFHKYSITFIILSYILVLLILALFN
jgi:Na+/H+ antiporter NhaD/arsenite permease-like protein